MNLHPHDSAASDARTAQSPNCLLTREWAY